MRTSLVLPFFRQMQESFSRSSVSCLINANLQEESVGDKKSDPCWQVTQQLHYHIEKVCGFLPVVYLNLHLQKWRILKVA